MGHYASISFDSSRFELSKTDSPRIYAIQALKMLEGAGDYASLFIELRREFFHKFQNVVFPTSITVDFFENVKFWLESELPPKYNGHYEKNFCDWVKENKK
jgi:hypothetical protein